MSDSDAARPQGGLAERLDPLQWAAVQDQRQARHAVFWRAVALASEACAARLERGELWLDVGCGPGHVAAELARLGARVVGVDSDPRMASYAARRWQRPFLAGAAAQLPVRDGACAGVAAVSLLGYLARPEAFFAAVARVLRPGGTFCFSAMNARSALLVAAKATAWRGWRRGAAVRYAAHDPAALVALLADAGFVAERQILYGHFVAFGRLSVPGTASALRREREVAPGTASAWARQVLLVARRAAPADRALAGAARVL